MSSIKQIAALTGLSVATVSHVINGTRRVSDESRSAVLKAIEETGYKPNYAARMLRTQCSQTIVMLIPRVQPGMSTNIFFMDVLSGAKDYLQRHGYHMLVSTYDEGEEDGDGLQDLAFLERQWVDGILMVPNKKKHPLLMEIVSSHLPLVLLDRAVSGIGCPCVYCNGVVASQKVVQLLSQQGKQRIGYLGGSTASFTGHDRHKGYSFGLEEAGLPYREELVVFSDHHTVDSGYQGTKQLVEQGVDAIYVSNNVKAVGVLRYLNEHQIAIPDEVAVVGFEDYEWMEISSPPLTTVRQQPYQMGEKGAWALLQRIQNPEFSDQMVLDAEIVCRRSHGNL